MLISQPLWPNLAKLQWDFSQSRVKHLSSDWYCVVMREGWGTLGSWLCHQSAYSVSQSSEGDWGIKLLSLCAFLSWSLGERSATLSFSSGSCKQVIIWVFLRQILEYSSYGPQFITSRTNLYCGRQVSSLLILGKFGLFFSLSFSYI